MFDLLRIHVMLVWLTNVPRYQESKVGLRWRTQPEVVSGKGQFTCGCKGCSGADSLCSYEVNFAFVEAKAKSGVCGPNLGRLRNGMVSPSCIFFTAGLHRCSRVWRRDQDSLKSQFSQLPSG